MARYKSTTQTTRIKGARVILKTTTNAAGETKVTVRAAPVEEWLLQASAVRALKAMPEYASTAMGVADNDNCARTSFTIAGDMNGDFRSQRAAVKATATGIAAGDPDLRVYGYGGRLLLIEYKAANGKTTASQKIRHPLLRALGYRVEVLKVATEAEAAERTVALVSEWLAQAPDATDQAA